MNMNLVVEYDKEGTDCISVVNNRKLKTGIAFNMGKYATGSNDLSPNLSSHVNDEELKNTPTDYVSETKPIDSIEIGSGNSFARSARIQRTVDGSEVVLESSIDTDERCLIHLYRSQEILFLFCFALPNEKYTYFQTAGVEKSEFIKQDGPVAMFFSDYNSAVDRLKFHDLANGSVRYVTLANGKKCPIVLKDMNKLSHPYGSVFAFKRNFDVNGDWNVLYISYNLPSDPPTLPKLAGNWWHKYYEHSSTTVAFVTSGVPRLNEFWYELEGYPKRYPFDKTKQMTTIGDWVLFIQPIVNQ